VSHPIPLHPDADLAVVLDDMRQSVAAWGDEGMVMRVFKASICLMLLGILDTLIELLADFRAGRLPPVLPAVDQSSALPSVRGMDDSSTIAARSETRSPQRLTSRPMRAPRDASAKISEGAPADAPEHGAVPTFALAPRYPARPPSPSRLPASRPEHGRRRIAVHPSHVPRWRDWANTERSRRAGACCFRYDIGTLRSPRDKLLGSATVRRKS
jgi:hypothetical protein